VLKIKIAVKAVGAKLIWNTAGKILRGLLN
jgi:hypothetical protein